MCWNTAVRTSPAPVLRAIAQCTPGRALPWTSPMRPAMVRTPCRLKRPKPTTARTKKENTAINLARIEKDRLRVMTCPAPQKSADRENGRGELTNWKARRVSRRGRDVGRHEGAAMRVAYQENAAGHAEIGPVQGQLAAGDPIRHIGEGHEVMEALLDGGALQPADVILVLAVSVLRAEPFGGGRDHGHPFTDEIAR